MKKKDNTLAIEKGLIVNEDKTIYNKVLYIYKLTLIKIIDSIVDFNDIDKKIENSNLYFGPSKTLQASPKNKNINSKYFAFLNPLFIEKLSIEDINILKNKELIDNETINIVLKTLKDIITKDGVSKVCYNPPMPKHFVDNGTLVLQFVYGKNTKKITGDDFFTNDKAQKEFIEEMTNYIKTKIKNKLNIDTHIFVDKMF